MTKTVDCRRCGGAGYFGCQDGDGGYYTATGECVCDRGRVVVCAECGDEQRDHDGGVWCSPAPRWNPLCKLLCTEKPACFAGVSL